MRSLILVAVTVFGFSSNVYAANAFVLDCQFNSNTSTILYKFEYMLNVDRASGVEVSSGIDPNRALNALMDGNLTLVKDDVHIIIMSPKIVKIITPVMNNDGTKACAIFEGEVYKRYPNKQ